MKITTLELKAIIQEAVKQKLREVVEPSSGGINWEKMKVLHSQGKLHGKWHVIMTAYLETDGSPEKTLATLKSAVATLELHKQVQPTVEPASEEDMLDFSSLDMM